MGLEQQLSHVVHRDVMHRFIDEIPEGEFAFLVVNNKKTSRFRWHVTACDMRWTEAVGILDTCKLEIREANASCDCPECENGDNDAEESNNDR